MTSYSTRSWDKRNIQILPSGEMVVREILGQPPDYPLSVNGFGGAVTVRNPATGQVSHYLLCQNGASMAILLVDENFANLWQTFSLPFAPVGLDRYGFCVSQCGGQVLITSPYFATLWGVVGGGFQTAQKVASINSLNTTAQDIPKGISVAWAGRVVIADVDAIWFSDPLAPQTFVAENALSFPGGQVYGLHVSQNGALIICSEGGVFALSEQAAATGQIVVGIFQKLSDHPTIAYETTCAAQGRVWGLTEKSVVMIDSQVAPPTFLDEDLVSRTLVGRIASTDYRAGRIYGTALGHIVTFDGYMHVTETQPPFNSWWFSYSTASKDTRKLSVRGILVDHNGEEIIVVDGSPLWRVGERTDYVGVDSPQPVVGSVAGIIRFPAEQSPVVRRMFLVSDSRFAYSATLQGVTKTAALPTQVSPICDTDSWGSGFYKEIPVKDSRVLWSVRTRDPSPEIAFQGYPSRIPEVVDISFQGPGPRRP